jgi:hypothetical protein
MDGQSIIEADTLVEQVLSAMELAMHERAVHVVIGVNHFLGLRMSRLFREA